MNFYDKSGKGSLLMSLFISSLSVFYKPLSSKVACDILPSGLVARKCDALSRLGLNDRIPMEKFGYKSSFFFFFWFDYALLRTTLTLGSPSYYFLLDKDTTFVFDARLTQKKYQFCYGTAAAACYVTYVYVLCFI